MGWGRRKEGKRKRRERKAPASYRESRASLRGAAGSELLRVSNPGRLSDITPFLVG